MNKLPTIHAMLHTLPLSVQRVVRMWFQRGVPRIVRTLADHPDLYDAVRKDLSHTP